MFDADKMKVGIATRALTILERRELGVVTTIVVFFVAVLRFVYLSTPIGLLNRLVEGELGPTSRARDVVLDGLAWAALAEAFPREVFRARLRAFAVIVLGVFLGSYLPASFLHAYGRPELAHAWSWSVLLLVAWAEIVAFRERCRLAKLFSIKIKQDS